MESPVKTTYRLARKSTCVGGVDIPAGTTVMVAPGAINRDPNRFEDPNEFRLDRPNVREHIAFARGAHTCPGAPLARVEGWVSLERILDRMADIRVMKPNTDLRITAATATRRPTSAGAHGAPHPIHPDPVGGEACSEWRPSRVGHWY
jgi:cytochrome P450